MKRRISIVSFLALILVIAYSCKKTPLETAKTAACEGCYEITAYYGGTDYILTMTADSTVFADANFEKFQAATSGNQAMIEFSMGGELDKNRVYFFDNEYQGYEYVEEHVDKLLGRRFKFSHRIDQLRTLLEEKYGERIDYTDESIANYILGKIQEIYTEQHYTGDLPTDLEAFVGIEQSQFSAGRSDIMTIYEHYAKGGASLVVETSPAGSVVNYGPSNCYTMAAIADLGTATMSGGTSWNDQVSSANCEYVSGASGMAVGFYKHRHFLATSCNSKVYIMRPDNGPFATGLYWYDLSSGGSFYNSSPQGHSAWWCGSLNDSMSSIKVKAVWSGCQNANEFDDMY